MTQAEWVIGAREKISEHPFEKISERSLLYIAKR
jgi:hypothetical protein